MSAQWSETPESPDPASDPAIAPAITPTMGFRQWLLQPSTEEEVMQIEGIFRNTKQLGLGVLVYFAVGIYAVHEYIATHYIVAFLILLFTEMAFKIIVSGRFMRADTDARKHRKYKISYCVGMIYFSTVYGLIALIILLPMPYESRLVVFAVFLAVACSLAASSLFMQRVTSISFAAYVAPLCIALIVKGTVLELLTALVIFLCGINIVLFNRQIQKNYSDVFTLFLRNKALLRRLSTERGVSDSLRLEAEKAVDQKNRFIATASHDLRQPLHAIGLFNHALRHMHQSEANQDVFESMQRSIDSLNTMFDSLLDISRLDANAISPSKSAISLDELFESMAIEFLPACEYKDVKLIVEPSRLWVHSDPTLLRRILQNVIANSVKYCHGGHVKLSANVHDGQVLIVIEDTGEGIAQEQLDLVFNEFHQLDRQNGESSDSGVGLGLSIVRRLCNLLDNRFELVSELGVGTRFTVLTELIDPQIQTVEALEPDALDLGGIHVLVIDDDQDIVAGLSQVLRFWQCTVYDFDSADAVLSAAAQEEFKRPDIILCDYQLGQGWNGLQLLEVLLPDLAVVTESVFIISGESTREALAILDAAEFQVLTKPVRPTVLRNAIAHSLNKNR